MTEERQRISRMELFSGSLVIFVGVFYLLAVTAPLFQQRAANPVSFFSLQQLKMIFYILFYLAGGVLLLMTRKPGWIICTASLLNIVMITAFLLIDSLRSGLSVYQVIPFLFLLLSFAALSFLFNKEIRLKHEVTNKMYLITLAVYFALILITYKL